MKSVSLLLFVTISSVLSGSLYAAPVQVQIDHSEPWGYYQSSRDKDLPRNELKGIWIEVISLFSLYTDIDFKLTIAPRARVLQNLEYGKIDMSFLNRPDQDSENVLYVAEMFTVSSIAVSMKDSPIRSYEDLAGKRIGMVRGTRLGNHFDKDTALFKQFYRNCEIIVNMLFQNRLDAIVGDSVAIPYLIKKQRFKESYSVSFTLRETSVWIQFSALSPHQNVIRQLIAANKKFKHNGLYRGIVKRYSLK